MSDQNTNDSQAGYGTPEEYRKIMDAPFDISKVAVITYPHVHTLYRAVDGDYICSGCEAVFVPK